MCRQGELDQASARMVAASSTIPPAASMRAKRTNGLVMTSMGLCGAVESGFLSVRESLIIDPSHLLPRGLWNLGRHRLVNMRSTQQLHHKGAPARTGSFVSSGQETTPIERDLLLSAAKLLSRSCNWVLQSVQR